MEESKKAPRVFCHNTASQQPHLIYRLSLPMSILPRFILSQPSVIGLRLSIVSLHIPHSLGLYCTPKTTAALVIVVTVFIAYLPSRLSAAVLPALLEARVEIGAYDALVELGAADVLHAVQCILVRVVLDEAEAAGSLVEPVEAHDQALNLAALGEELVDLLFRGIEGPRSQV